MALEFDVYYHTNPDITTITDLLSDKEGIGIYFKNDRDKFMNYSGDTGRSNMDRIFERYDEETKESIGTPNVSIDDLKINTELIFPKGLVNKELLSISGKDQFLEQSNFNAFYGDSLLKLLKDPLYRSQFKIDHGKGDKLISIFPNLSVWVYSGALNEIINLTPFILNCSVTVNNDIGTFSITLPYINSTDNIYKSGQEIYSNNYLGDNHFSYFHKYIQSNDIVFIKFEKLDLEGEFGTRISLSEDLIISKSLLANQVYDMIGLVDSCSQSTSFDDNESTINIEGRDLMKLIIDDSSYFIPLQFIENSDNLFFNLQDNDKLLRRSFITGSYESIFAFSLRDIATSAQFIINQLSNLGVVDDDIDLFSSYGQRRTKVYRIQGDNETLVPKLHKGIWQIVKLLVDENVSDRRVADSSISQPDNNLQTQFYKICQDPFVEFFGDTHGDTYNLIIRQPPFTKSQIISVLDGTIPLPTVETIDTLGSNITQEQSDMILNVEPEDVITESLDWESSNMFYSWYEITPQGSFIGSADKMALAFVPIVYIPEYADKWGMKKLSVVSNYISNQALIGKDTGINADLMKEAVMNDFKYLLDSHVYLPFTRRGTIVINGDRRFKRGTWFRYKLTGELFYIDAVANEISLGDNLERTTTLSVSRGMREKFIKNEINYFDIINTQLIKESLIEQLTTGGISQNRPKVNIKSNFLVNKELFNFFYRRKQMEDTSYKTFSDTSDLNS